MIYNVGIHLSDGNALNCTNAVKDLLLGIWIHFVILPSMQWQMSKTFCKWTHPPTHIHIHTHTHIHTPRLLGLALLHVWLPAGLDAQHAQHFEPSVPPFLAVQPFYLSPVLALPRYHVHLGVSETVGVPQIRVRFGVLCQCGLDGLGMHL